MAIIKRETNKRGYIARLNIRSGRTLLIVLLALAAMLSLAACGDTVQPTATTAPLTVAPTATILASGDVAPPSGATLQPSDVAPQASDTAVTPSDVAPLSEATPPSSDSAAVTEVQATLREWAIDLSQTEVPAGKVKFVVTNQSAAQHNLTVTNSTGTLAATPNFSSRQGVQTLEVDLQPGTYTLICSLPGHAARGQKTELVVK